MRKRIIYAAVLIGSLSGAFAQSGNGAAVTVKGWVLDSACAYTKGIDKPIGVECAKACARNGSPLVILRDDGTIFLPIDGKTPSASQNPRLLPFAGERVTVSGTDYIRNGSHALVIQSIAPLAP